MGHRDRIWGRAPVALAEHLKCNLVQADMEELLACPGIGPTKVRRLYETFHEPFRRTLHDADGAQADTQPAGAPLPADAPATDSTAGAAASAAVTTDGIAEIGGGDDDVGADDPHAGAFMFL
jgi:Helix-hairpin-helix motif